MDRLLDLVLSFYREEPEVKELLQPLRLCKFQRSWGSITLDCLDATHLQEVSVLISFLETPFAALGLCKEIILRAPGLPKRQYLVKTLHFSSDQFT